MPLEEFLPANVFAFFLVFARLGAAFMFIPGFGEQSVPRRIRLVMALVITVVVVPLVSEALPAMPGDTAALLALIAGEILVGLFFGLYTRMLILTLETAGRVIAFHSGLAAAQAFNPNVTAQSALPSAFLGLLALVLVFSTDTHHLLLRGLIDSYAMFVPAEPPPVDDMALFFARGLAESFSVAVRLASPFIIAGLLVYTGFGILGRLMPQVQVFFLALPAQILNGLVIMSIVLSGMMLIFFDYFQSGIAELTAPP